MYRHRFKFRLHDVQVKPIGINGGTVSLLYRYLLDTTKVHSDIVLLQIGSNDISNVCNVKDEFMPLCP